MAPEAEKLRLRIRIQEAEKQKALAQAGSPDPTPLPLKAARMAPVVTSTIGEIAAGAAAAPFSADILASGHPRAAAAVQGGAEALGAGIGNFPGELIRSGAERIYKNPNAPQTFKDQLKDAVKPSLEQAALAGALPLVPAAMSKAKNKVLRFSVEKAIEKQGGKVAKEGLKDAVETVFKNPEISKPGYFRENIGSFVEDVAKKLDDLRAGAKALGDRLRSRFGKRVVANTSDIAGAWGKNLGKVPEEVLASPHLKAVSDQVGERLANILNKNKSGSLSVESAIELKSFLKDQANALRGNASNFSFVGALENTAKELDAILEKAPKGVGELAKKSRETFSKTYSTLDEMKNVVGAKTDLADVTDATLKKKTVAFLKDPAKLNDSATMSALESLDPKLAEEAKKLSAVNGDPFKPIAPHFLNTFGGGLGLAATGWAIHNAPAAAGSVAALGGMSLLPFASPRVAGALLRGDKKLSELASKSLFGSTVGKTAEKTFTVGTRSLFSTFGKSRKADRNK